jgi:hypothetical protein
VGHPLPDVLETSEIPEVGALDELETVGSKNTKSGCGWQLITLHVKF